MAIGTRGGAVCYPLHVSVPAQPSRGARFLGRVGLGGTFVAVAVTAMTLAMGVTGMRLSAALAARSDLPLNADTASDVIRYRMLGSVVANQPLTNDLEQEIDSDSDEEERPSLFSQSAFNAGAFETECQAMEARWVHADNPFPANPSGDPIAIVRKLLEKQPTP